MRGSPIIGWLSTHPNLRLSSWEPAISGTTVPLTTQKKLLGVTLDQSLSTHKLQLSLSLSLSLSLNPVSITFVLFATFGQFWVKTQPISLPVLLFLPVWTMHMHVCLASLSRIYLHIQRIQNTLARVVRTSHAPNLGPALPLYWNNPRASSFSSHSKLPYLLSSHSTP